MGIRFGAARVRSQVLGLLHQAELAQGCMHTAKLLVTSLSVRAARRLFGECSRSLNRFVLQSKRNRRLHATWQTGCGSSGGGSSGGALAACRRVAGWCTTSMLAITACSDNWTPSIRRAERAVLSTPNAPC
eukprot:2722138-Pleurochrysis_carterae.AAC.1